MNTPKTKYRLASATISFCVLLVLSFSCKPRQNDQSLKDEVSEERVLEVRGKLVRAIEDFASQVHEALFTEDPAMPLEFVKFTIHDSVGSISPDVFPDEFNFAVFLLDSFYSDFRYFASGPADNLRLRAKDMPNMVVLTRKLISEGLAHLQFVLDLGKILNLLDHPSIAPKDRIGVFESWARYLDEHSMSQKPTEEETKNAVRGRMPLGIDPFNDPGFSKQAHGLAFGLEEILTGTDPRKSAGKVERLFAKWRSIELARLEVLAKKLDLLKSESTQSTVKQNRNLSLAIQVLKKSSIKMLHAQALGKFLTIRNEFQYNVPHFDFLFSSWEQGFSESSFSRLLEFQTRLETDPDSFGPYHMFAMLNFFFSAEDISDKINLKKIEDSRRNARVRGVARSPVDLRPLRDDIRSLDPKRYERSGFREWGQSAISWEDSKQHGFNPTDKDRSGKPKIEVKFSPDIRTIDKQKISSGFVEFPELTPDSILVGAPPLFDGANLGVLNYKTKILQRAYHGRDVVPIARIQGFSIVRVEVFNYFKGKLSDDDYELLWDPARNFYFVRVKEMAWGDAFEVKVYVGPAARAPNFEQVNQLGKVTYSQEQIERLAKEFDYIGATKVAEALRLNLIAQSKRPANWQKMLRSLGLYLPPQPTLEEVSSLLKSLFIYGDSPPKTANNSSVIPKQARLRDFAKYVSNGTLVCQCTGAAEAVNMAQVVLDPTRKYTTESVHGFVLEDGRGWDDTAHRANIVLADKLRIGNLDATPFRQEEPIDEKPQKRTAEQESQIRGRSLRSIQDIYSDMLANPTVQNPREWDRLGRAHPSRSVYPLARMLLQILGDRSRPLWDEEFNFLPELKDQKLDSKSKLIVALEYLKKLDQSLARDIAEANYRRQDVSLSDLTRTAEVVTILIRQTTALIGASQEGSIELLEPKFNKTACEAIGSVR